MKVQKATASQRGSFTDLKIIKLTKFDIICFDFAWRRVKFPNDKSWQYGLFEDVNFPNAENWNKVANSRIFHPILPQSWKFQTFLLRRKQNNISVSIFNRILGPIHLGASTNLDLFMKLQYVRVSSIHGQNKAMLHRLCEVTGYMSKSPRSKSPESKFLMPKSPMPKSPKLFLCQDAWTYLLN